MYPEYDQTDPSLGQAFANILRGFKDPNAWQQTGQGIVNTAKIVPNVVESLARGGVAQAVGTMGDLRDLRNTVQSYLPQSVQNFGNAAEFLTNPYAKALIQTAPTTEETLDFVPRITPAYEGSKMHETVGEYIAPALGYFGSKALNVMKDLPVGMTIKNVTEPAKVAEVLRAPEKNELGYYSALDEAVANLQNQKGTGQQYLAQLLKTGGIKQEEIATRGLDNFLAENPKVSKEQIAQYLRENPVELKETVIGGDTTRNLDTMRYDDYYLDEGRVIDDPDYVSSRADDIYSEEYKNDQDLIQELRDNIVHENPEQYADWEINPSINERLERHVDDELYKMAEDRAQLEYDESPMYEHTDDLGYRVTGSDDIGYHVIDPQGNAINYRNNGGFDLGQAEEAIREHALESGLLHMEEDEVGTKYHDYTLPNGENYREVLLQYEPKRSPPNYEIKELPESFYDQGKKFGVYEGDKLINTWTNKNNAEDWLKGAKDNYKEYGNFESGHFDEPNILAHLRTTDRTIDGKKTLFVEEIQSDWHQAGRKKGYNDPKALQEIQKQRQILLDQKDYYSKLAEPYAAEGKDSPPEVIEGWTKAANGLQELDKRQSALGRAVPDAPFKKNWQELAMKRAMQMAAEGGYDRVAFTTGKQQAERYNLAKYVDRVIYDNETGMLRAFDKNNQKVMMQEVPLDQVDDYIGKEAARKLGETKPNEHNEIILNNADLQIGGEGMKGFYDKILPDFINKYGKKHGLKVGKTALVPPDQAYLLRDADGHVITSVKTKEKADQYIKDMVERDPSLKGKLSYEKGRPEEDVHYFDLTPEAKESFLKKGQPMFAVAPALGITDEDSRREILEKLFNSKK